MFGNGFCHSKPTKITVNITPIVCIFHKSFNSLVPPPGKFCCIYSIYVFVYKRKLCIIVSFGFFSEELVISDFPATKSTPAQQSDSFLESPA